MAEVRGSLWIFASRWQSVDIRFKQYLILVFMGFHNCVTKTLQYLP